MTVRRVFLVLLSLAALPILAQAQALVVPRGRIVLSVSGKIELKNQGELAVFDMAMIEALPQHSYTTSTPWFDKPVKFTGPLLADVLVAVGARGTVVNAVAINNYKTSIPMLDIGRHKIIIARLIDDQPISVRNKGPLFVVYPFDSDPELRTSVFYERAIWQLKALELK